MRKSISYFMILLFMVAMLAACTPTKPSGGNTQEPENRNSGSSLDVSTDDTNLQLDSNIFKTETVTLDTVELRTGDRLIMLIDAGWTLQDNDFNEHNFEESADDLTFYRVELEHANYPNTYLNVSLDSYNSKPGELVADAYIEGFHLLSRTSQDKIDFPWSIGGVVDYMDFLEDTLAAFPGAEKDVTMYNDEMLSTKLDLDSYCEGSTFLSIRLDWWAPSDTYTSFAVEFNLDVLDIN